MEFYAKLITFGIAALLIVGGITWAEVKWHNYKEGLREEGRQEVHSQLDPKIIGLETTISDLKSKEDKLVQDNLKITLDHQDELKIKEEEINKQRIDIAKRIKDAQISKQQLADCGALLKRVFADASKAESSTKDSAPTVKGNDAASNWTEGFLKQLEEDNSNHKKCVEKVKEWQDFWLDYTKAVESVN